MALTGNVVIKTKVQELRDKYPVVSGAVTIYKGAILNRNASGYLKLGADAASEEFGGIALDYLAQATGGSNGDNLIEVIAPGSGIHVLLPVTSTITIANEGNIVYADGDDKVDIASGVTNNVAVGVIKKFVTANSAWVQLVDPAVLEILSVTITNLQAGVGITLPTSEPAEVGSLWNDGGIVTVSNGP